MLTRPHAQLRLQGTFQSFVIMFQPSGLDALFPVDLKELTGHDFDAGLVLGRPIAELEERLGHCQSFHARVKAANAFLARRISCAGAADRIATATQLIDAKKGRVLIPDLASAVGIGQRQFERDFGARYGMRPKLYARIVRFQSALDSKARSATKSWTDVAHEFGYHDQMHLIHDFEAFTFRNPDRESAPAGSIFPRADRAHPDRERSERSEDRSSVRELAEQTTTRHSGLNSRIIAESLTEARSVTGSRLVFTNAVGATWTQNVRTLSELLRGISCAQRWRAGGAGRIERFEGRRWRLRRMRLCYGD